MNTNQQTLKLNSDVRIIRANLASSLAASLPDVVLYNPGKVKKINGDRILVGWKQQTPNSYFSAGYWFDSDAVEEASIANRRQI